MGSAALAVVAVPCAGAILKAYLEDEISFEVPTSTNVQGREMKGQHTQNAGMGIPSF
jgi:hypothetical protein